MSEEENNNIKDQPVLECPHCKEYIIIEKLNCGIFRHGVYKIDGKQMNPHAPKEECDFYNDKQLIYGCGKPFKITLVDNKFVIEICDYI
jgi:hypothetical protein